MYTLSDNKEKKEEVTRFCCKLKNINVTSLQDCISFLMLCNESIKWIVMILIYKVNWKITNNLWACMWKLQVANPRLHILSLESIIINTGYNIVSIFEDVFCFRATAHSRQAIIVKCNISYSINVDEKHRRILDYVVFVRSQHSTTKFTYIRFFAFESIWRRDI